MNKKLIIEFTVPYKIQIGRKYYSLNINLYRNKHYYLLNQMKHAYQDLVFQFVSELRNKNFKYIAIKYTMLYGSQRKPDMMNVISIVDKFLLDALVNYNVIEDDKWDRVKKYIIGYKKSYAKFHQIKVKLTLWGD